MSRFKRLLCLLLAFSIAAGMACSMASAANSGTQFSDVGQSDWFFQAVQYAQEQGIMKGNGAGKFSPYGRTTRCMLVMMLYRMEGMPAVSGGCPFEDVASGAYYRKAVIWAAENQIVSGLDAAHFAPDNALTREQLATILYRYAKNKGYRTEKSAELARFSDQNEIGPYAMEAMRWAVAEGLLTGVTARTLQPKGDALRAQVAAILMRFCEGVTAENTLAEPDDVSGEATGEAEKPAAPEDNQEPAKENNTDRTPEEPETPALSGLALLVGKADAAAGDKNVTIRISVQDNPGILGMRFSVSYDESVLTLTGASNGEAVRRVLTLTKAKTLHSGCNFVWDGIEIGAADIQDGAVLELQFQVSDSAAAGKYPITIRYSSGDIVDNDLQSLSPQIQNGYISIK